jgi:hypothetical protein
MSRRAALYKGKGGSALLHVQELGHREYFVGIIMSEDELSD